MAEHDPGFSVGISGERFPEGLHLCHIFNDDAEREKTLASYLARGIAEGEQGLCLHESMPPERVRALLADLGLELPPERFQTAPAEHVYCPGGDFAIRQVLEGFGGVYGQSLALGFKGTRISGDMAWAARRGTPSDKLIEYEALVKEYVARFPVTAMCEYDARRFDGATLLDILALHPAMIVRGQILKNPFYVDPAEYLARRRERLAQA
jgi:hypothetical protein